MTKSVVLSSGHSLKVRGAAGYLDEVNEARRVVDKVAEYLNTLGTVVNVFHDNTSTTQNQNLSTIVNAHNSKSRELDVSIHLNASTTTDEPRGVEVYYVTAESMANNISNAISSSSGLKNRGGKKRDNLYFLNQTKKPSVLIEICFVDSKADADIYKKNFDSICKAIAETISGKKLTAPTPEVKQAEPEGIGTLKVLGDSVIRKDAVYTADIIGSVKTGGMYIVHDFKNGWFNIGGWVHSDYVHYMPLRDVKITR